MSSNEKIDIVIQGPYTDFTDFVAESYLKIPFVNRVIISCWNADKLPIEKRRIKFVRSDYPDSPGTDNKNMQIVSSLNGLKKCETDYAVKVRSDQRFTYDSMMKMYDFFFEHNQRNKLYEHNHEKPNNRILVAGIYTQYLFSFRDHMFWGHTDDLIELFDIPLERHSLVDKIRVPKDRLGNYVPWFTRTETYLGAHYCSNFFEEINRYLLDPQKFLYDNAEHWFYVKEISDKVTYDVFKSFPKSAIELEWVRFRSSGFSFNFDEYLQCAVWHEEGY